MKTIKCNNMQDNDKVEDLRRKREELKKSLLGGKFVPQKNDSTNIDYQLLSCNHSRCVSGSRPACDKELSDIEDLIIE